MLLNLNHISVLPTPSDNLGTKSVDMLINTIVIIFTYFFVWNWLKLGSMISLTKSD